MKSTIIIEKKAATVLLQDETASETMALDLMIRQQFYKVSKFKEATVANCEASYNQNGGHNTSSMYQMAPFIPISEGDLGRHFELGAEAFKQYLIDNPGKKSIDVKFIDWLDMRMNGTSNGGPMMGK
jgi:hypothetical protein